MAPVLRLETTGAFVNIRSILVGKRRVILYYIFTDIETGVKCIMTESCNHDVIVVGAGISGK